MSDCFDEFSRSMAAKSVYCRRLLRLLCAAISGAILTFGTVMATHAQDPPDTPVPRVPNPPLASDLANLPGDLRAVEVPGPSNLDEFVKDPVMAVALGKALFW